MVFASIVMGERTDNTMARSKRTQGQTMIYKTLNRKLEIVDYIFMVEFEIKDTTDASRPASYLVLHLKIDSEVRLKKNDERWYFDNQNLVQN
jgi:hypothetical protein